MKLTMQEKIEVHLSRSGMTVGQLGEKLGWTREWTSMKINGRSPWKFKELESVADALGIQLTELMEDKDCDNETTMQ